MKIIVRMVSVLLFLYLFTVAAPVRAEESVGPDFFPINGVTLGKTNVDELLKSEGTETEKQIEVSGSFRLNSIEFGYEERILVTLVIDKNGPMPLNWKNAGFDWDLSYQEWVSLLERLGFSVKTIKAPTLQMKADHPVMEAEFEAFRPAEYPTVFTFSFKENTGTGVVSKRVLYQISARYIQDFERFTVETESKKPGSVLLPESKRKALALSGIAAEIEGLNHETLELASINQANTEYWKEVLAEKWGLTKRDQLLKKMASLQSKGDSLLYRDLVSILKDNRNLTINQMGVRLNYDPSLIKRLYFVKEKQELIGDRALQAWDYSRAALLCRIGYQVGFLSDNEAWNHLQKALIKVEALYQSWEDYAANYIMGVIFQASELGRENEDGNQALQAYAKLINNQGSAWRLTWNSRNTVNQFNGNKLKDALYFPPIPYRAWTCYLNGRQNHQKCEYNKALEYYQNGLALDQEFSDLWLSIAAVYKAQTNYEKAIDALNEYLQRNPSEYLPRIYLGEVHEKNKQLAEAVTEYNKAIALNKAEPEGFVGLGRMALNSGDYELAVSYLRIAESLYFSGDRDIFYTLFLLGYSYYKAEKFDKAQSYFLRAYGNYRDNLYLNYYLGICYLYNQNIDLASKYLDHATELGLSVPQPVKELLTKTNKP